MVCARQFVISGTMVAFDAIQAYAMYICIVCNDLAMDSEIVMGVGSILTDRAR